MRISIAALIMCSLITACSDSEPAVTSDSEPAVTSDSEPAVTSDAEVADGSIAIVANSDIAVGEGRLLVAVANADGSRAGSPSEAIAIEVAPADQPELRQRANGTFTWIIEDAFGLYRSEFSFDRPGIWNVTVVPADGRPFEPTFIEVREDTIAPGVGDPAPAVPTPTIADAQLNEITTDPEPAERFYQLSLDQAANSGARTVAVFSTPAFCRTATCGPVLDQVKAIAPDHPDVNFVHVEIYTGFNEPDFVPDGDHLAPTVTASGWNLPTEPWVFVIDETGVISHRFEGVLDPAELLAALG